MKTIVSFTHESLSVTQKQFRQGEGERVVIRRVSPGVLSPILINERKIEHGTRVHTLNAPSVYIR